jgi:pimeloyl-ACP methyl ester carboxylesterase
MPAVRVAVVSEFYPRDHDPVLGVWAHRQALAARDAGADVRVVVLHRVVPPRAALRDGRAGRGAERVILPRCGHAPHRDRPEETLVAMAAFVLRVLQR